MIPTKCIRFSFLFPLLVFLLAAGCSKQPEMEIAKANTAAGEAIAAEAAVYAPEALQGLEESQKALQRELEVQEKKFALFRNYDEAKIVAESVRLKAEKVRDTAVEKKTQAQQETAALIESTRSLLTEVQTMLASAPTGKGTALDIQVMKADLVTMESDITEASKRFMENDFMTAQKHARVALSTGMSLKSDLTAAMEMKGQIRPASKKG